MSLRLIGCDTNSSVNSEALNMLVVEKIILARGIMIITTVEMLTNPLVTSASIMKIATDMAASKMV